MQRTSATTAKELSPTRPLGSRRSRPLDQPRPISGISEAEFNEIVRGASDSNDRLRASLGGSSTVPNWAGGLREMFSGLGCLEFGPCSSSPLRSLCECGARYAVGQLEHRISPEPRSLISGRAISQLKAYLERNLARISKRGFDLELSAFASAFEALRRQSNLQSPSFSAAVLRRQFLGPQPSLRLFQIFRQFPVLARLWLQQICYWCDATEELLVRFAADRAALSRDLFAGKPPGKIIGLRPGLSDPHNRGRTVMLLQVDAGFLIYKPRPGNGEWQWQRILQWLNGNGFAPPFRTVTVLRRREYCWMERVKYEPCAKRREAGEFYERLGGLMAAACHAGLVDCHRDNLIASGEHPVLVDLETILHPYTPAERYPPPSLLMRTGFLAKHTGVLGARASDESVPRIGEKIVDARSYQRQLLTGFQKGWRCIAGSAQSRRQFTQFLTSLARKDVRWIPCATTSYERIKRASIQPDLLRSGFEREKLIRRACARPGMNASVLAEEVRSILRLDIPYLTRKATPPFSHQHFAAPKTLTAELRQAARAPSRSKHSYARQRL